MRDLNRRVERLAEETGLEKNEEEEQKRVSRAVLETLTVEELRGLRSAMLARDAGEILSHEQLAAFEMWEERRREYLS